jgi:hypothetical protein
MNLALFSVISLCSGCTLRIGGDFAPFEDDDTPGDSSDSGGGEVPRLPEPSVWHVPPPDLTPEQAQRKDEVDAYLAESYGDYQIVEATQGYSGDVYYWVDNNSLPPQPSPPPPTWTADDLVPAAGAQLGWSELEEYPELRGPDWTTPIHRPDFWNYIMGETGAASVQDYLENHQVSGQPFLADRLYAGLTVPLLNMGVSGNINQFQGDVEPGTFSLIELAVACPAVGPMVEQIGVVVSRDRANFGDAQTRLHVEYLTQGGAGYGLDRKGGWDEDQVGFVPYPNRRITPGQVVPASLPGLGTQVEHRMDIFQSASGDWWIAFNGELLGHYPANLFTLLSGGACRAGWYGEVFDSTPTVWTWTDMGSGEFASAGYGYASFIRNPKFRDYIYGPWDAVECPSPNPLDCYVGAYDDACYTRSYLTTGSPPWSRYFYLGGPGGNSAGCY